MCDIRVNDAPEIGVIDESGRKSRRGRCLDNGGLSCGGRGGGHFLNETRVNEERAGINCATHRFTEYDREVESRQINIKEKVF